jgi:hypothetical protein
LELRKTLLLLASEAAPGKSRRNDPAECSSDRQIFARYCA